MKKTVILILILSLAFACVYAKTDDPYTETNGERTKLGITFKTGQTKTCSVGFSSVAYSEYSSDFPKDVSASQSLTLEMTDSDVEGELKTLKAKEFSTYAYWIVSNYKIKIKLSWDKVKDSSGKSDVFTVEGDPSDATTGTETDTTSKTEKGYIVYYSSGTSSSGSRKITVSTMDLIDEPYGKTYTLNLKLEAITVS